MNPKNKLLSADLAKPEKSNSVLPHSPMLSSERSGWNGMFLAHYQHPAFESPEHQWLHHLIGITALWTSD